MLHEALKPDAEKSADILLPAQQNLHDYAISIKDLRMLQTADTIFYLGGDNEHFLQPLIAKFPQAQWHALAENSDHAWLDPTAQKDLTLAMSQVLTAENSEYAAEIEEKTKHLLTALAAQQTRWQEAFKPHQGQAILLGHTAIVELLRNFGLKPVMYIAGHSHGQQQSGTKELLTIQASIKAGAITCALEEPDVSFRQLTQRFPALKTQHIDPNGSDIAVNSQAFINLLESINQAVLDCLQR